MDLTTTKTPARYPLWQRLRARGQLRRDPLGTIVAISQRGAFTPLPFPANAYLANTPAFAAAILVEQGASVERSTTDRRLLGTLLGDGLLMSREPRHRRQRKRLSPACTPTHVQSYGALIAEAVERLQASWSEGTRLDPQASMSVLSLEIVVSALFGTQVNGEVDQVRDNLRFILHYLSRWMASVVPPPLEWPHHRRYQRALRQLDTVVQHIFKEARVMNIPSFRREKADFT